MSASFVSAVADFGALLPQHAPAIHFGEPVTRTRFIPTRFPPCVLCDRPVGACECDVDEAHGAALAAALTRVGLAQ